MRKPLCFLAGLMASLMLALIAIAGPATRTGLFVRALQATVDKAAIQVSDEDLAQFGEETMRYLRSEKEHWEPTIRLYGVDNAIAPAFYDHMAQVRSWVTALPWLIVPGLALLWFLRRPGFLAGMLTLLGLVGVLVLWAAIDFHSFWMVLHRVLIPDGIFSAREPVMQLFPLGLFLRYLPWVLGALAAEWALVLLIFFNKGKRKHD